jgi:polyhydroxyalkanoic acid synthase PhaR subunit
MANQNFADPLKIWKELYDTNEKFFGKMVNDYVQKEEFSSWMGTILDFNLYCKKMLNDQSKLFLDANNFPSKDDIASVASMVVNVEAKVDALEEQLDDQQSSDVDVLSLKKDVAKLKTDTKSIQTQIGEVKSTLSNIEELLKKITSEK